MSPCPHLRPIRHGLRINTWIRIMACNSSHLFLIDRRWVALYHVALLLDHNLDRTSSSVGGLQRLIEGPLGCLDEPDPPGARKYSSQCGLWTRSITGGGALGGSKGASGGSFLGEARLAGTTLLEAPAGGPLGPALLGPQDLVATDLKSLKFRSWFLVDS